MVHKAAQQIYKLIYKNDKQTCKSNGFFAIKCK